MFKKANLVLVFILLATCSNNFVSAQTTPTVSWYYRGSQSANGTSLSVNSGSTLILGCLATAKNNLVAAGGAVAFVIAKGSIVSTYTLTPPATGANGAALSVSGGTILYDSINGNRAGYDYIVTSSSIAMPYGANLPVNGYLNMYIPSLTTSDAGTYYCAYIDGSAASSTTATSFSNSGSFTLTITTKSGSGSQSISGLRNRAIEYSLLLFGASKILL